MQWRSTDREASPDLYVHQTWTSHTPTRERVRPRKYNGIALEDKNFVSEDLPLPGWNPDFTPGDGSGTSEAPLPDDFFANLPPGFTTPASLDEASRREVVAEGSRLINEV
ncbi:hypothetical protein F2Q70_00043173 [Brassica cretica]|uniref:Uncharacterized protein n=1 Tax=Brassica cretica TaxID=69181 RepID=A0A8S9KFD8_BRACR|nr:hypothetical protein F2Q70_00043173 [Brassica cretica]